MEEIRVEAFIRICETGDTFSPAMTPIIHGHFPPEGEGPCQAGGPPP